MKRRRRHGPPRQQSRGGQEPWQQPPAGLRSGHVSAVPRIALLDVARGVALIGMTVFHFAYDLVLFDLQESGYTNQFHWKYLAKSVATTFLLVTGASLYLAHVDRIRWRGWSRRFLKIAAGALAITIATWFAVPESFVFFGILHVIALASVIGLVFVQLPWWISVASGLAILAINSTIHMELLNAPFWHWTGLSEVTPRSIDYFPVFPWLAPALLGIGAARLLHQLELLNPLAIPQLNGPGGRFLRFLGRNSLVYYLLHQPVLVGFLWGWVQLTRLQ